MDKTIRKAILFDFDGVVVDSEPLYEQVEQKLFDHYNITVTQDDWDMFKGISADNFFKLIKEKYIPEMDINKLAGTWQDSLLEVFKKELDYMPGFLEFYDRIKHEFEIALVTATGSNVMEWIFKNTHIEDVFTKKVTASDVKHTKPHPEPYLTAAQQLGIPVEHCIVIEDSIHGIESGYLAGAKVIGLTSSIQADKLKKAHKLIDHFDELNSNILNHLLFG